MSKYDRHSLHSLSCRRSIASSKASNPPTAIYYFLLQVPLSSLFLNHTQPGPNCNNHSNHITSSCLHLSPRVPANHLRFVTAMWGEKWVLTLNPLTWKIWWAPNNASKWQMGFNPAYKGLKTNFLFPKPVIYKISPV